MFRTAKSSDLHASLIIKKSNDFCESIKVPLGNRKVALVTS